MKNVVNVILVIVILVTVATGIISYYHNYDETSDKNVSIELLRNIFDKKVASFNFLASEIGSHPQKINKVFVRVEEKDLTKDFPDFTKDYFCKHQLLKLELLISLKVKDEQPTQKFLIIYSKDDNDVYFIHCSKKEFNYSYYDESVLELLALTEANRIIENN